ncbi:MAG: isoprenyl transferase [Hyphomicrobiales bacterium]|nr:isoprenyl transferase [Hyphomicrobiales bacterium]
MAPVTLPTHVAIIMDGNGRWAKIHGLRRAAGHKKGAEAVKRAIEDSLFFGVKYLTLFGFSSENWKRPKTEIKDLMGLLDYYLSDELSFLEERSIRFRVIGERERLPASVVAKINRAEAATAQNRRLTLIIALSYGGRAEITEAARKLAKDAAVGRLRVEEIDEQHFSDLLYTHDIPDPDLVIRTSGEKRISNFLLWQSAYAELVFLDTLWPDFSRKEFEQALQEFGARERRYGASGV